MIPLVASLVLTGLDLAIQVERNRHRPGQMPSEQSRRAAETVGQFRQILASAVRENRNMAEDEIKFWFDRVNADRNELKRRADENKAGRGDDPA
jgi:hypothetical protein